MRLKSLTYLKASDFLLVHVHLALILQAKHLWNSAYPVWGKEKDSTNGVWKFTMKFLLFSEVICERKSAPVDG